MRELLIQQLAAGTTTDFDLFTSIEHKYYLYAPAPYSWTAGEIQRLEENGFNCLYYSITDAAKAEAYELIRRIKPLEQHVPPAEQVTNILAIASTLTKILYEYPLTETSLALIQNIGKSLVTTIVEDPHCISALGKLEKHDEYTYFHSARVSAYATALAVHQSLHDQDALLDIAVGCLLHDLGKRQIKLEVLNKPTKLDSKEWHLIHCHPEWGLQLVTNTRLSVVAKSIILSHHERLDGKGYPHNLGRNEILFEVRLAAFADVFDALTTNRPYQASQSRFAALNIIQAKLLPALDKEIFRSMVELLRQDKVKR